MSETLTISGVAVCIEALAFDAATRTVTLWHDLWRARPEIVSPVVLSFAGQPALSLSNGPNADPTEAWREPLRAALAAALADPPALSAVEGSDPPNPPEGEGN